MEDETRLYRLNSVVHVTGFIDEEPTRVISGVRRQQNMPLHDWIITYLETAGLYHLARLNSHWFWVDEPLLSAFIERWRPETHTFHMPFRECTITLQNVAYQLGPIDGEHVSGCLTEFENLMKNGRPAWVWFRELFGELPLQSKVKQMTVCYTWFHERFRVLPANASEETVRIYTRAYILMLLSSQLFVDKNANRVHLRWLPYLASLDELGRYSWGSTALTWLPSGFDGFRFPLASRWATYLSRNDVGGSKSGVCTPFFGSIACPRWCYLSLAVFNISLMHSEHRLAACEGWQGWRPMVPQILSGVASALGEPALFNHTG
ncbi:uncharacterized protein DS421_5g150080 [Arachis hypogaea]|nr:uncharacterized protein DS421_5g150080 [Arachis hypogaea]